MPLPAILRQFIGTRPAPAVEPAPALPRKLTVGQKEKLMSMRYLRTFRNSVARSSRLSNEPDPYQKTAYFAPDGFSDVAGWKPIRNGRMR